MCVFEVRDNCYSMDVKLTESNHRLSEYQKYIVYNLETILPTDFLVLCFLKKIIDILNSIKHDQK